MVRKAKPREVWTRERCYITELLNDDEQPEVSIARARVEPGITTELHALSVYEWYVIETGRGLMRIGDREPFSVESGDTVMIPKNCAQQISNNGSEDLEFLCVCAPRFWQESYTPLE
ncbi:MAG: cupin domain-containing protein [Gammaproteobacteria bacterium]|nr:cupin domain-containing protein [Gammaproteobacteria bacterium]